MVWSYSELDPTDPNGRDAMVHNHMGTQSLNLLAKQPGNIVPETDEPFLDITVTNVSSDNSYSLNCKSFFAIQVTIPSASTTYWCQSFSAPSQLRDTVHYINRVAIFSCVQVSN